MVTVSVDLEEALHMNTEERKGNEGKNLSRMVAILPVHRGEIPESRDDDIA